MDLLQNSVLLLSPGPQGLRVSEGPSSAGMNKTGKAAGLIYIGTSGFRQGGKDSGWAWCGVILYGTLLNAIVQKAFSIPVHAVNFLQQT